MIRNNIRRGALIAAAAAGVLSLGLIGIAPAGAAAPTGPNTPKPQPLASNTTINVSEGVSGATEAYLVAQLAQYFGEFSKENLSVNFSKNSDANATPLLESNKLQAAVLGFNAGQFNAISLGGDFRWVLPVGRPPATDQTGLWVQKSLLKNGKFNACTLKNGVKNGTTVVDLGSAVGASGPIITYYSALISQCKGLTLQQVLPKTTFGTVSGADLLVGLQTGSLNISLLYDPLTSTPGLNGYAAPILLAAKVPYIGNQDVAGWALNGQFMKSQPKVAKAFLRAMVRTERTYLQGNFLKKPAVVQAITSVTGLTTSEVQTQFSPLIFNPVPMDSAQFLAVVQKDWQQVGNVMTYTTPLTQKQVVSNTLLNQVLAGK